MADDIERLFRVLAEQAGAGVESALRRLRMLHQAIIDREEQGDRLARMLPGGIAEKLRREGRGAGDSEELDVTVLMSDMRGYSAIAERVPPTALAGQLNGHRAAMNRAILSVGGTVMQYVGDAVMAVFGAPERCEGHELLSVQAAAAMHESQSQSERRVGEPGPRAVPSRHRRFDRAGRGGDARLGGAPRVHAGRRRGEPRATVAAVRRGRRDGVVGTDVGSASAAPHRRGVPAAHDGEGQDSAGRGLARRCRGASAAVDARRGVEAQWRRIHEHCKRAVVHVSAVYRTFEAELAPVRALRGASLEMASGEFVAIMGPSGCGKSTLLNLVAGLDRPDEGSVEVAGISLDGLDESAACDHAAQPRRHRVPVLQPLRDDDARSRTCSCRRCSAGTRRRVAESRARDLLDLLGIGDKAEQSPTALSGGQRQRLAIARALSNEPTMLLADEPTGALDSDGGNEILELFRRLHAGGQTILLVTHDQPVADAAQRIVRMRDGRVVDPGSHADTPEPSAVVAAE